MAGPEKRTIFLWETTGPHRTDDFFHLGFEPPLTHDEFEGLPTPRWMEGDRLLVWKPFEAGRHPEYSELRFRFNALGSDEGLLAYAEQVAAHLGNCVLDPEIEHTVPA